MNCLDVGRYLHIYLDGEFAPDENIAFDDHLVHCQTCRQRVAGEKAFLRDFRSKLQPRPAPAHFRARLTGALTPSPGRSRVDQALQWVPLAIAALILAVVAWPSPHGPPDNVGSDTAQSSAAMDPAPIADAKPRAISAPKVRVGSQAGSFSTNGRVRSATFNPATTRSFRRMHPDVRGDSETVMAYLSQRLPFETILPLQQTTELRLVGARQTHLEGKPAALFVYERAGDRVAVIQSRLPARAKMDSTLRVTRNGSTTIARFNAGGFGHIVICELAPGRLSALLAAHLDPSLSLP